MAKIDELVQGFLAQKKIAIVGVSDKRETGCNLSYKKFKEAGYQVYAVNPRISSYEGAPCYPDLKSIPERPDAVFMLTNPKITEADRSAVRGFGYQTCLDALHDGNETRSRDGHDQCFPISGGDVQSEWHRGHSGVMPESVFTARFRSCNDAWDVEVVRVYERELTGLQAKTSEVITSEVFYQGVADKSFYCVATTRKAGSVCDRCARECAGPMCERSCAGAVLQFSASGQTYFYGCGGVI